MSLRARNIKPGFFQNETLGELPVVTRLLFAGLWLEADREGRLEDRPKRIAGELFPYDRDIDVEAGLAALEQHGFIVRYCVGERQLIQVQNFKKHQSPHHTEKASVLPAPPASGESTVTPPPVHREDTVGSPLPNGGNPPDSLIHRFSDSPIPDSPKQTSSSEQKTCSDPESEIPVAYQLDASRIPTPSVDADAEKSGGDKSPSRAAERLADLLKVEILRNKPDYRITSAQLRTWPVTADLMLRRDGRSEERIASLIRWVQHDDFWMTNVLSMKTLREKFDQLEMKRAAAKPVPTEYEAPRMANPADIIREQDAALARKGAIAALAKKGLVNA